MTAERVDALRCLTPVVRAWIDRVAGDRVAGDGVAGDGVAGDGVAGDRVAAAGVADPRDLHIPELDDTTIDLARQQRVGPLLYDAANRAGAGQVTDRTRDAFYRSFLRNQQLLAAADQVVGALVVAGIRVARLKGADLLMGTYPNPGLRPMDDIDLLIARHDVESAVRILERLGYAPPGGSFAHEFYLEHHFHLALVEPQSGSYVELHWELLDGFSSGRQRGRATDRRGLSGSEALAAAVPVDPARPERGLRLDAATRFVYQAVHVDKHGPFHEVLLARTDAPQVWLHPASEVYLIWLVDLALLATRVDPARVVAVARAAGVERAVHTTLRLAEALLGPGTVPPPLLTELAPPPHGPVRRLVGALVGTVLLSDSRPLRALVARAAAMDHGAQMRPLRLLSLPLTLLARERASGPGAVRRLAADSWRATRLAAAVLRQRVVGLRSDPR